MSEKISIVGNIAGVPERRDLPRGGSVTSFRVAVTHRRYDQAASTWVDDYTNWYTVSAFRALGEHAYRSLAKGDRVVVSGRFRLREWEAGGRKGVSAEIDADALGHDLLWGTSTFERRPSARPEATTESTEDVPADVWTAPGTDRELVASGDAPF